MLQKAHQPSAPFVLAMFDRALTEILETASRIEAQEVRLRDQTNLAKDFQPSRCIRILNARNFQDLGTVGARLQPDSR